MELKVVNDQGQQTATLAAADTVFGREYNEALVHQIVVAYQANARLGTRAQLTREAVHHSTRKPWRQKGTGRARAGMSSSPVWRGGAQVSRAVWPRGVTAPRPVITTRLFSIAVSFLRLKPPFLRPRTAPGP